ncbi:MAG TPA: secretin N-terminal domain-containing protein [Burkholderiaceae bacterium]
MAAGNYEHGVQVLEEGANKYPDSGPLRSALVSTRTVAVERILESAAVLSAKGQLDEADAALDRALQLDSLNERAKALKAKLQIERRQAAAVKEAEALIAKQQREPALKLVNQALKDDPRHPRLLALQRSLSSQLRQQQIQQAQTALAENRPISLDFREANLRTVLDLVSRNSGINFIIDKDIRPDIKVTVLMKQARVEDALDLIISTNQLAKKVIDPQTIVIYPNTPEKQREYQEQVVRVFHLANAEAKAAAGFLKAMLKIRDPFVDERTNMLSLRDSPENIDLAERLLALYDTSEPEVLLEVEVLEINENKTLKAGVSLPSTVGFSISPTSTSSDGSSAAGNLTLATVRHLTRNDIAITVGGASVNLNNQQGDFTTLANPRIRAKNKEKAKIMVGEKIPVISATTGQAGFVSDTVTYLDVGLKLDVEPTVYADDDVMIKLGLEVSTLGTPVQTSSGTLAYQISSRNATTVLRLHDGESQLLAGLISKDESHSSSGIPGLDSLPLLGRMFSNKTDTNDRTELVLVITPHIIRNIRPQDASETELWVGTEAQPRIRPVGGLRNPAPKAPAAVAGPGPSAAQPPQPQAQAQDGTADQSKPAQPSTQMRWNTPGPVKTGDTFELSLDQDTQAALRGETLELSFNGDRLQLLDAVEGDFFKQGGAATSFSRSGDPKDPGLRVGMLRNQAIAATGHGRLLMLRFKALSAGAAEVKVLAAKPIGLASSPAAPAALPSVTVQIN